LFNLDGSFIADSHITILRPIKNVLSKFILYSLAHIGFKTIERMAKGASGQIELSLSIIGDIKIPIPPLSKQKALIDEVEILEAKIDQAKTIIEGAKERKEKVMEKYL